MAGFVSLKKVAAPRAAAICQDIDLDPQAVKCLESDPAPVDFLNTLLEKQLYPDALRFLARALPKREATWWACICTRGMITPDTPPAILAALEAAEQWVYKPTEANRRLADAAARATSFDGPAAWAAMAAFWSEGSMAPEDAPVVPPADNLTAKAVTGAVMLAAVIEQPERVQDKYRFFLEQGVDIANGGNGRPWPGQ